MFLPVLFLIFLIPLFNFRAGIIFLLPIVNIPLGLQLLNVGGRVAVDAGQLLEVVIGSQFIYYSLAQSTIINIPKAVIKIAAPKEHTNPMEVTWDWQTKTASLQNAFK